MRTRMFAWLLLAAMFAGIAAYAQAPSETGQAGEAASTEAVPSTAPTSTTLRMHGTLDKYEASTRILSLSTPTGTLRFPLAPTARIRQNSQEIDESELQKFAGYRAAVRYSESDGNKTVESVHVFGKAKG